MSTEETEGPVADAAAERAEANPSDAAAGATLATKAPDTAATAVDAAAGATLATKAPDTAATAVDAVAEATSATKAPDTAATAVDAVAEATSATKAPDTAATAVDAVAQARRAAGAAAEPEPAAQAPVAAGTGADPHTAGARARIAVAVLGAATVGCLFYGVDRTRAALTEDPYDPLLILESARIDYFWRIGISGFLAVTVFLALLQWRGAAEPERLGQAYRVALVALALSTFLSAVFP